LPWLRVTLKAPRTLGFPLVTVGDHIKKRRLELGLFRRDAAKRLGVCETTVKNWEKGYRGNTAPLVAFSAEREACFGAKQSPEEPARFN
jgi:DNA-binding XRE family transcriptional regulator